MHVSFLKSILSSCTNIFGVTYGIHYDDVFGETGLRVRHVDVRAAVEDVDGAVGLADPVLAARAGVLEGLAKAIQLTFANILISEVLGQV